MSASDHLLVRACRGEPVERTPVWAMRQAGRWDPEFQKLCAGRTFYEFSENPELAAAASLCPRRFGVDAIILFYDITTLAVAMGQSFSLAAEVGPVPERPIRTLSDVAALSAEPSESAYRHVLELLRLVRQNLNDSLPVLVFAGAPFTLGTYQIGTGKDLAATRMFIADQPAVWEALLDKVAIATERFMKTLLAGGAAAYQIFDSWAGGLTREEYLRHAQPYHQRIFQQLGETGILFVKDCAHLDLMAKSGAPVLSLGTEHDLAEVKQRYPKLVVQGNVSHELLVTGTPDEVKAATRRCLQVGGGHRHVLNLDHGMDRAARPENFAAFVEEARSWQPGCVQH